MTTHLATPSNMAAAANASYAAYGDAPEPIEAWKVTLMRFLYDLGSPRIRKFTCIAVIVLAAVIGWLSTKYVSCLRVSAEHASAFTCTLLGRLISIQPIRQRVGTEGEG